MPETQIDAPRPDAPRLDASGRAIRFAGLLIHPLDTDQAVAALAAREARAPFTLFVTPNIEHIYLRHSNAEMDEASDAAFISTNDSRILLRAGRLAGLELAFAPGAYVIPALFRDVIRPDERLSMIGGTPELAARVRAQFGLTNLVQHIPPMGFINNEAAIVETVAFIAAHPSRFVFVCMGPPQSERLCLRVMQDGRSEGIGLCVGSSLTVLTGQSDAAPDWMERAGLVWLYRLVREPKRLWKRYLVRGAYGVGACLVDIVRYRLGLKRVDA